MYITTQIVKAVPMTAYEYQISQGYEGCEDLENINGYKITDDDGVMEWICEYEFKKI